VLNKGRDVPHGAGDVVPRAHGGCPQLSSLLRRPTPSPIGREGSRAGHELKATTLCVGHLERGAHRKPKKTLQKRPKTLPRSITRQNRRPSPYRVASRGGAGDQVPAKKPCEAERATKSLPSNLTRQSRRPSTY
jgi:hypothetical protein